MEEDKEFNTVQRASEGDPEAFRELVERYGDRIFSLLTGITGNRLDPEGNPTTEITMKDILEFNFIWMEPTEEALAASLTHFDGDVDDYGADETMGESYVHDGKVYLIFYVSHAMGDYTVVRID